MAAVHDVETDTALAVAGSAAVVEDGAGQLDIGTRYLGRQIASIGGGTTEMARNVIGERVLNFPREHAADRGVPFNQVRRIILGLKAEGGQMSDQLRDIRELTNDADAYRDELFRRWTGLLSYRYIGRKHSSMNLGEVDNTVTIRRDMRNEAGGIMVAPLAISSPEGCQTDMVAVPNPVIASVQIIDPGYDVTRVEIVDSGVVHQGRTMGYGRCKIVDADNPDRVIAFNEGQGAIIGIPPEGLDRMDVSGTEMVVEDSPDLPPLWAAFGASKRDDGHWVLPALSARTRLARCGVAHRAATCRPRDRGHRPCRRHRRDQKSASRQLARHVHVARQGGPLPGGGHCACRRTGAHRGADAAARRGQRRQGRHLGRGGLRGSGLKLGDVGRHA